MNILICGFGERLNIEIGTFLCYFLCTRWSYNICASFTQCAEKIYSAPFDMVICNPEWKRVNPEVEECIKKAKRKAAKGEREFKVIDC